MWKLLTVRAALVSWFVVLGVFLGGSATLVAAEDLPIMADDNVEDDILVRWRNEEGWLATEDALN